MTIEIIKNTSRYAIAQGEFGQLFFGKIYRYMDINGIKDSFLNDTLRFKSVKHLDDNPFECNPRLLDIDQFDFDKLSPERKLDFAISFVKEFFKKYLKDKKIPDESFDNLFKEIEPIQNLKEITDKLLNALKIHYRKLSHKNPDFLDDYLQQFDSLKSHIKVCCFSRNYKSTGSKVMWSLYADSHKGACIEFDYGKVFKSSKDAQEFERNIFFLRDNFLYPFMVSYEKQTKPINYYSSDREIYKWICIKDPQWKFQQEVRLIMAETDNEIYKDVKFPYSLLNKVIFGLKTDDDDISEIIKTLNKKSDLDSLKVEKMYIDKQTNKLKSKQIDC